MPVLAIGRVYAIAGRRDELVALVRATAAEVRRESGCTTYEWAAALDEPDEFVLVQEWESQAALEAHYRGDPFKATSAT